MFLPKESLVGGPPVTAARVKSYSHFVFVLTKWQSGWATRPGRRLRYLGVPFWPVFSPAKRYCSFTVTFLGPLYPIGLVTSSLQIGDAQSKVVSPGVGLGCHCLLEELKSYHKNVSTWSRGQGMVQNWWKVSLFLLLLLFLLLVLLLDVKTIKDSLKKWRVRDGEKNLHSSWYRYRWYLYQAYSNYFNSVWSPLGNHA